MDKKNKLLFLVLAVVAVTAMVVLKTNKTPAYKKGASGIYDTAVSGAMSLYKSMVISGVDMSQGPCLTNDLMQDWVVDIVHSPREGIDDLPENQCQAYIEGRAEHFVEMDTNGNLVRVR